MDELLARELSPVEEPSCLGGGSTEELNGDDSHWQVTPCDEVERLLGCKDWRSAVALGSKALSNGYRDGGKLHCLLGDAFVLGNDYQCAIQSYREALKIDPTMARAMVSLGVALILTEQIVEGERQLIKAVDEHPEDLWALKTAGRALEAISSGFCLSGCFEKAIALGVADAEIFFSAGMSALKKGSLETALSYIEIALESYPRRVYFLTGKGIALRLLERYEDALAALNKALLYDNKNALLLLERGNVFVDMHQWELAVKDFQLSIKLNPTLSDAHTNLGNVFKRFHLYDDAAFCYLTAMELEPKNAATLNNIGSLKRSEGDLSTAVVWFERALTLDPCNPKFLFNKAICLLQSGDFKSGWNLFESRLSFDSEYQKRREQCDNEPPLWVASPEPTSQQVLILAEQGFGDFLQFCRYIPKVCQLASEVIVEVPEPIAPLLKSLDASVKMVPPGQQLTDFESHRHIMSLAGVFGSTVTDDIPSAGGYLSADASKVARWQRRTREQSFNIGLAWFGSRLHANDHNRSISFSEIRSLSDIGSDIDWHSLHAEDRAIDAEALDSAPWIRTHAAFLTDFSETAALIECLDLVITVDTSIAHLAGALGKPVWILLPFAPDYRWPIDGNATIWYESARLFRQPRPGDWGAVLAEVSVALDDTLARSKKRSGDEALTSIS